MSANQAQTELARALTGLCDGRWALRPLGVSGFCATWRAECAGTALFVKTQPAAAAAALHAEADGLRALAATATVRVPAVEAILDLPNGGVALALEWLDLRRPDPGFGARFGAALAALHRAACPLRPPAYGWDRDNWLGATPQTNRRSASADTAAWVDFFAGRRLEPLALRLESARGASRLVDATRQVIAALPRLFDDGHRASPSLIHGDLWSGNWGMLEDGVPVMFDPAVSCSDAEAELAMMELFGAPPPGFWPVYRDRAGLHSGYSRRRPVYQLYHLLNHVLLFGGGYESQALDCAQQALRP